MALARCDRTVSVQNRPLHKVDDAGQRNDRDRSRFCATHNTAFDEHQRPCALVGWRKSWRQNRLPVRLPGFNHHADGSSFLIVDRDLYKERYHDDIDVVVAQVTASDGGGFHGLVDRSGPDSLNFGTVVLTHNARNGTCNGSRARPR